MNHKAAEHPPQHQGEFVRDPVCGMDVDPKSIANKESFAGQTYCFCSQSCLAKFQSEPKRYVTPPAVA
jgi:YHS domain-containing protein